MSSENSTTHFVQGVFYKLCFFVGLGTLGFQSYAQVGRFITGDATPSASHSELLQGKLQELEQQPNSNGVVERIVYVPVEAKPMKPSISTIPIVTVAAPALADASANPSASPSPSPGTETVAGVEKKDGDAPKEGEGLKAEGEVDPNAPVPVVEEAYYPPYSPYVPQMEAQAATAAPSPTDPNAANAQNGAVPPVGNLYPAASSTTAASGGGGGSSSSSAPVATLSANDMSLLATAVKGVFTDSSENVSGTECQLTNNVQSGCTPVNSIGVHTSRWTTNEGLLSAAGFSVKALSASRVQVTLNLSIQNDANTTQSYSATVVTSQMSASNEIKNGKTYRVLDFKLPNMTVRSGDTLTSVEAVLVYDPATSAPTADSALNFSRAKVTTVALPWDPSPNRTPASSNEQVIDADQIVYSMEIEKS